jgi:phosphoglycolate phosphatase-like HAD superfamily hydrolase
MPAKQQTFHFDARRIAAARNLLLVACAVLLTACAGVAPRDPLPSWNEGPVKSSILKIVADTTREGAPGFVPSAERIATFDNDGTLWNEHPMYVEVMYTLDRIKVMAPQHPEWKTQQPFAAVVDGDRAAMAKFSERDFFILMAATRAGQRPEDIQKEVATWLAASKHPRFNRPYTDLVYQPMLEVLAFFRANGYKTFIVTGGTIDFVRSFAERAYGVPPEQVVGTTFDATYSFDNGVAAVRLEPKPAAINDGPGKPIGMNRNIGRLPIAAFGNSDGDIAMLEITTNSPESKQYPRLGAFVWHTDAVREYAYDKDTSVGRLDKGLTLAPQLGWQMIDMKRDWKVIFPYELR